MIRVGLVFEHDRQWMGGVNYFRNLLAAVAALPDRRIEPVIVLGSKTDAERIEDLHICQILYSPLAVRHSPTWWARKLLAKVLLRDILLERFLRRHHIDVLSHSGCLGKGSDIPSVSWVADLQHKRMPHFFSRRDIFLRDHTINAWCQNCAAIILSSYAAKADMQALYPQCRARLEVLQFVSRVAPDDAVPDAAGDPGGNIPRKYFLVANQFWAHKNHRLIIEALAHLKSTGRDVQVVATGNTQDYRHPGYYAELMEYAKSRDVTDRFRVLGIVPALALGALLRGAVAIVNPSEFEGWNTAVEEAKSQGKMVVLSDIPVHREQAPEHARFFSLNDPVALANTLWNVWEQFDAAADEINMKKAVGGFHARQREFAMRYQEIIEGALRQADGQRGACSNSPSRVE